MGTRALGIAAAAGLLAAALLASGCGTKAQAASGPLPPLDTVAVRGEGSALTKPDKAEMTFALTSRAGEADNAMKDAGTASQKLVKALKDAGVAADDLQTTGVMLNAEYDWSGKKPTITGYAANVRVRATVRALDKLGALISIATEAGADEVQGPIFEMSDDNPAKFDAIEKAVADAKLRAEAMAKAAGRKVGKVRSMSEPEVQTDDGRLFRAAKGYAMDSAAVASAPQIETGQLEAAASLDIVFDLE